MKQADDSRAALCLQFLRDIAVHNNREWFHEHREEYDAARAAFESMVAELIARITVFDPAVQYLSVGDCTYRFYRDTRFSPDKSPYKRHFGAYINAKGKKAFQGGYYFHLEPTCDDGLLGNHLLAAGAVCIEPTLLRSIREEVLDHGSEMRQSIHGARGFRLDTSNSLKRVPTGFPSDSEFADLLKLKDYCMTKTVSEEWVLSGNLTDRLVEEFRRTKPFIDQLNRAIRYAWEEM